jgi:predicted dehydrogenase
VDNIKNGRMKNLRVGVIGVGQIGSLHVRVYSENKDINLVCICDIDKSKADRIAKKYHCLSFKDYRDVLKEKLDAISICVPTKIHYPIAKELLQNEINVLVEKPFTETLTEADELIRIARKNNLVLHVGHIERFNSAFQKIREIVHLPKFIECHRLSKFPKRSLDVGVVLDLMIHDLDIILNLVKSPIKRIEAVGINVLTEYEDIANARIIFKNGCICNLTASRVSDEVVRKIRIFLEDTYISLDYLLQEVFIYKKKEKSISKDRLPVEKTEPLKEELDYFLDCIREHKKTLNSALEAREALKVALRIQREIWKEKS